MLLSTLVYTVNIPKVDLHRFFFHHAYQLCGVIQIKHGINKLVELILSRTQE